MNSFFVSLETNRTTCLNNGLLPKIRLADLKDHLRYGSRMSDSQPIQGRCTAVTSLTVCWVIKVSKWRCFPVPLQGVSLIAVKWGQMHGACPAMFEGPSPSCFFFIPRPQKWVCCLSAPTAGVPSEMGRSGGGVVSKTPEKCVA